MGECLFTCAEGDCENDCVADPSHDPGEHICAEHIVKNEADKRLLAAAAELRDMLTSLLHWISEDSLKVDPNAGFYFSRECVKARALLDRLKSP